MSLNNLYEAYTSSNQLVQRIAGACIKAKTDIYAEDPGTSNHANRLLWAVYVEANPLKMAQKMVIEVLENPTIEADPGGVTDSDIEFVVNSLIDTFANRIII